MNDFARLARFAEPPAKKVDEWAPVVLGDLALGNVLAFDQSLASTGWVHLQVDRDGACVVDTGTLKNTGEPLKGSARVLERFEELVDELHSLGITRLRNGILVVHESPPSAASMRPESSLLAAAAVRVGLDVGVDMVQAQHVKKIVTGNGNAKKPEVARAVRALTWIDGIGRLGNEHQRDALAIAVTFMVDEKDRA